MGEVVGVDVRGRGVSAVDNPFYSHEFHGDYELISIGRLDLEEGESIPDCQLVSRDSISFT